METKMSIGINRNLLAASENTAVLPNVPIANSGLPGLAGHGGLMKRAATTQAYTDPRLDLHVPQTLGEVLIRNAECFGDRVAIFNQHGSFSHRQFFDRIARISDGWRQNGVSRQDRVAFLMGNGLDITCLFGAAEFSGFIAVPLNWRLSPLELERTIKDCKPKVLVFEPRFADVARQLAQLPQGPERVFSTGGSFDFAEPLEALVAAAQPDPVSRAMPNDIVYLIYTSGSSGQPKGVMLDQKGQLAAIRIAAVEMRLTEADRALITMPLFHVGAKMYQSATNMCGGPAYMAEKFDATEAISLIAEHRLTVAPMVPTMVETVLNQPSIETADLSSLRMILYTGAAMPRTVIKLGIRLLGPRFMQMFGQTENVGGTSLHPHHHALEGERLEKVLGSVGQPGLLSSVKIIDEYGNPQPRGVAGEVLLKSEAIMRGYWNNSIATVETLRDGWVWTGDIGVVDEDGFLFIVGRRKDMIITGGENVFAGEVEEALLMHPGVLQAAVIGIPDPRWGEAIQAIVVLRDGYAHVDSEKIIEHCAGVIASYKKPKRVVFVDEIPKNPIGKIDKRFLREFYAKHVDGA